MTAVRPPVFVHWRLRGAGAGTELADEEVLRLAGEIAGYGVMALAIDGCDPLARACCLPVVERTVRAGMMVAPSVQGGSVAAAALPGVLRAGPHSLSLRVFSPRPDEHDAVVGEPGALQRLAGAAALAAAAGIRTVLTYSPLAGDLGTVREAVALARRWQVRAFDVVPPLPGDGVPGQRLPPHGALDGLHRWLLDEGAAALAPVEVAGNKHRVAPDHGAGCSAHAALAKISASGLLLACGDSDALGIDLRGASLADAWARLRSGTADRDTSPAR